MELPEPVRELIENFVNDNKMVVGNLQKKIKFWQPWLNNHQTGTILFLENKINELH